MGIVLEETVATDISTFTYTSARKLAQLSDGTRVAVYEKMVAAVIQIFCATKTPGGAWTTEQITDEASHQRAPAVAVGSDDVIHVAWSGFGCGAGACADISQRSEVCYRQKIGAAWQAIEAAVASDGPDFYGLDCYEHPGVSIAIDSNDDIHIIYTTCWTAAGYGDVRYKKRESGVWQAEEIADSLTAHYQCPEIAVDSSDQPHVVYSNDNGLMYTWRTGGTWQPVEVVVNSDYPSGPFGIVIDPSDNVHVTWPNDYGSTDDYRVKYRKRTAGTWGATEIVMTEEGFDSALVRGQRLGLDRGGRIHVVWSSRKVFGGSTFTRYRRRVPGGWQDDLDLIPSAGIVRPFSILWGNWPEVAGVKTNVLDDRCAFLATRSDDLYHIECSIPQAGLKPAMVEGMVSV